MQITIKFTKTTNVNRNNSKSSEEWGFEIFKRRNVIRSKGTVIYLAILFSKLQVSSDDNTDFGCLKVTVE